MCFLCYWYLIHQWTPVEKQESLSSRGSLCWFLFCLKFLWYIISFHVLFKMRLFSYIFSVFSSDSFYLSVVSRIYWPGYLDTHFPSLFAHHTIYCFTGPLNNWPPVHKTISRKKAYTKTKTLFTHFQICFWNAFRKISIKSYTSFGML